MTERSVNESLIKVLRQELLGCVIIKHADRFTAGVPDMSVSWGGATTWLELKLLRTGTVLGQLPQAQLVMCAKLEMATNRCWIVVYDMKQKLTLIYRPTTLINRRTIPIVENYGVWRNGVIKFDQFDHHEVAELIQQSHD